MRFLLVAFLGCLLAVNPARADHIAGVDLTYVCVNPPYDYEFTITIYRDCAGIQITTFTSLIIESQCADTSFVISVPPTSWDGEEITPICTEDSALTNCHNNGIYPGYQIYTFPFPVTLPGECDDWVAAWTDCCRSINITNIQDPQLSDVYLFTEVDNSNGMVNSSPQYTNYPIFFTCLGQEFCYNPGAVDPDGDSLSYSLVDPREFLTIPVVWQTGYSAQQPLMSSPPVTINPKTGDLCMTATQLEVTVLAIQIDEYRDG